MRNFRRQACSHFDGRLVPEREATLILNGVGSTNGTIPAGGRHFSGVFQAHAASHLDSVEARVAQPYVNHSASITFDGRLDNREDLLLRLCDGLRDHPGDPLLALAAYEQGGIDGLHSLIGDWSLAIWDKTREEVILASDFAGVRLSVLLRPKRTRAVVDFPKNADQVGRGQ